jgi:hypothetical protein
LGLPGGLLDLGLPVGLRAGVVRGDDSGWRKGVGASHYRLRDGVAGHAYYEE